MFNVRLAGGHLYGKQLFTWLSLMVSLMASFCAVLFPLDVLDEIWDLLESVSEGFLTYSLLTCLPEGKPCCFSTDPHSKEFLLYLFSFWTMLSEWRRSLSPSYFLLFQCPQ